MARFQELSGASPPGSASDNAPRPLVIMSKGSHYETSVIAIHNI